LPRRTFVAADDAQPENKTGRTDEAFLANIWDASSSDDVLSLTSSFSGNVACNSSQFLPSLPHASTISCGYTALRCDRRSSHWHTRDNGSWPASSGLIQLDQLAPPQPMAPLTIPVGGDTSSNGANTSLRNALTVSKTSLSATINSSKQLQSSPLPLAKGYIASCSLRSGDSASAAVSNVGVGGGSGDDGHARVHWRLAVTVPAERPELLLPGEKTRAMRGSSKYRGVTQHSTTKRFESHLWDPHAPRPQQVRKQETEG